MKWIVLRFVLALLLPSSLSVGILNQPERTWLWILGFIVTVSVLELLLPNRSPATAPTHRAYLSWLLRLHVPLQLLMIAAGAWAAAQASWLGVLGLAFSVGYISGGQGITFAHELGHSKSKFDRFYAWVLMTSVCYGHFMVEHYGGHHPRAATYDDSASARYGETLYQFLPRTLVGSFKSGWQLEAQRIR